MDYGRPRDDRDGRGGGRGGYGRDSRPAARFSRDSPPLPIPLRSAYVPPTPSFQIPLRPAGPQRFASESSTPVPAYTAPTAYWRPDGSNQLPARPVQRYRSPPLAGIAGLPVRGGWESASARGRESRGGWGRDEFRSEGGARGWRDGERDGWDRGGDRDRGRTFGGQEGGGRRFEVPYRQQVGPNSRKRTRESSDEEDRDEDLYPTVRDRSRAGSVEWRGRNGQNGGRDGFERGQRRMGEGKGYSNPPLRYPDDGRNDRRRPPSPTGSDNSYENPSSRRPSNYDRDRDSPRRARSYSPGEISEGLPRRSPSPSSRSRSRSPPPSRDERPDRRDADDFRRRVPSNAEILRPKQEEARNKESRPPTNGYPFQQLDQGAAFAAAKRVDAAASTRPLSPRPPPSKPLPLRQPSPERDITPPRSPPRPRESTKFVPRADYAKVKAASPPPPPIVEVVKVEESAEEPEAKDASMRDQDEAPVEQAGSRPLRRSPSPYQRSAASLSPERLPKPLPPFEPAPPVPTTTLPQPPPPANLASVPAPLPPSPVLPPPNSPPSVIPSHSETPLPSSIPPSSFASSHPPALASVLSTFPQPRPQPISAPSPVPKTVPLATPSVPATATQNAPLATESSPSTEPSAPAAVERESTTVFRTPKPDVESLPVAMEVDEEPVERHAGLEEDEGQRSPSPRPESSSPPISPPRDFSSILGSIIAANEEGSDLANVLIESNRARTEKERTSEARIQDLTNRDAAVAQANHERLCPFLFDMFAIRDERRGQKMVQLRGQYKARNEDWIAHCRRLDRIKDKVHRRQPTATPSAPSIDQSGLPYYPEPVTPGPSIVGGGRANRRNANYGDAVRSEAEFLEILASLETADMHDPDIRATRTAAVVPDMVIDDSERRDLLALEDDRRRVSDPVEFYDLRTPLDVWTEEEVQIFCKRFSQHPKQFGKIAADLPEKTTAQAVLFYYRMKNTIDFRSLSDRRGRDGRRRKTRRRTDADGGTKKGASLLDNIKRARIDPRDEEDDSPPPSPRTSRKTLPAESPSVFQSGPTSRPPPPPQDHFDDDSTPANKKARTLNDPQLLPPMSSLLPSDGMMEAAEALGALAGVGNLDGDEADDDGNGKPKKRKLVDGEPDAKAAARRKTASSSYWTVAERNEFVRLLGLYGKDWTRLAEGLENKTAVQCRNWFQNHAKKLNLAEALKNGGFDEDDEGATTPGGDFTVPLGVPLSDAFGSGASVVAVPRAGFFLPESRSPRLPTLDLDDASVKAGMQFRNLLNDDTPDEEIPPPVRDDWFGGANGGDAESVTTEDESDVPKPQTRSPARRPDSFPSRPQDAYAPPFGSDPRYASNGTPLYRNPPPSGYSSSYPPPPQERRYEASSRQGPTANGHWQSSPASAYATYGTPPSSSGFYRRPLGPQDPRGHYAGPSQANRQEYFPPQKPTIHTYDRTLQRPSYPPPSASNYPQDSHRPPPPPPPQPQHGQWPPNPRR